MGIRGTIAAVLAGALLVLAACGGDEEELTGTSLTVTSTRAPATHTSSTPPGTASPAVERLYYVNPVFGYSFEYPADWYINTDPGGYVILTSYDPVIAKGVGGVGPGVKVDVLVANAAPPQTAAEWIAERDAENATLDPVTVLSQSEVTLPVPGLVRDVLVGNVPKREYIFLAGTRAYVIVGFPSDSPLIVELDAIVKTLGLPR